eukprot:749742-Hanusia_phi.AAC.4
MGIILIPISSLLQTCCNEEQKEGEDGSAKHPKSPHVRFDLFARSLLVVNLPANSPPSSPTRCQMAEERF